MNAMRTQAKAKHVVCAKPPCLQGYAYRRCPENAMRGLAWMASNLLWVQSTGFAKGKGPSSVTNGAYQATLLGASPIQHDLARLTYVSAHLDPGLSCACSMSRTEILFDKFGPAAAAQRSCNTLWISPTSLLRLLPKHAG